MQSNSSMANQFPCPNDNSQEPLGDVSMRKVIPAGFLRPNGIYHFTLKLGTLIDNKGS